MVPPHAPQKTEVGNASVGGAPRGTNSQPVPIERLPNNNLNNPAAAAAAAATAALAVAMGHAQQMQQQQTQHQQQHPLLLHPAPSHFGYQQQQQHIAAAAAPPDVFKHTKLRRGKWTPEEEDYAAMLIQEFEKGTVSGCENGCTLRAFLSKKLHCAPMRISKKYAGKSIGKHVFLNRKQTLVQTPQDEAKLKQLEMAFYKSLLTDRESTHSPYSLAPFMPPTAGARPMLHHPPHLQFQPPPTYTAFGHHLVPPAPPTGVAHVIPPAPPRHPADPTVVAQPQPPPVAQVPTQQQPQPPVGTTRHVPIAPAPPPAAAVPTKPPPPDDTTRHLHQSYVDALNQMQKNFSAAAMPPQHLPAKEENPSGTAATNLAIPPRPPETKKEEPSAFPAAASGLHDIPDILSGFDKAAAKQQQQNGAPPPPPNGTAPQYQGPTMNGQSNDLVTSPYSPPFTSRSFDDFHKFLGKDLLPLEDNNSKTTNAVRQQHKPELDADTLTADAYAMFAQESALAVSQHSAYCRSEAVPSGTNTPSSASVQQFETQPSSNSSASVVSVSGDSANQPHIHRHVRVAPNGSSVVNAANLRAHAKAAAEQAQRKEQLNSTSASTTAKRPQSYMRRAAPHIISASETSDLGTEESESAIGSSRGSGSEDPSDNTSNDSDSNSEEGPCVKKQKTCRQEAEREINQTNREVFAPTVSLDRASSQGAN